MKREFAANLFRGVEGVGGKIEITEKSLIFKPHSFNIQKKRLVIPFKEIEEIGERNTLFFIPNGLFVRLKSGVQYNFVSFKRKEILELIYKLRNKK